MDIENQIILYTGAGLSIISTIIGLVNHHYLRSKCFGRRFEIAIDIGKTKSDALIEDEQSREKKPDNSPV